MLYPDRTDTIIHSQHRVVSNDDIESEDKVPAPLNLPLGKLFFGFNIPDYVPPPPQPDENAAPQVRLHSLYFLKFVLIPYLSLLRHLLDLVTPSLVGLLQVRNPRAKARQRKKTMPNSSRRLGVKAKDKLWAHARRPLPLGILGTGK